MPLARGGFTRKKDVGGFVGGGPGMTTLTLKPVLERQERILTE